ncbi:MAG: hypothetical protein DSM106950_36540 [Stigonema ocellatum SAG 48.90 = DSM 106950]|nr:hypothetical protein [Stigonema ocellatum SAG 48.90 = DSM 106950]
MKPTFSTLNSDRLFVVILYLQQRIGKDHRINHHLSSSLLFPVLQLVDSLNG